FNFNPFTPAGYSTVRYPNANYEDQYDLMNQNISMFVSTVLRPIVYQMFQINNYLPFSNFALRSDGTEKEGVWPAHPLPLVIVGSSHYASIEVPHFLVHLAVGGPGGHMAYADITGFDPIFFFHHTAIDRLLALWQAML
ncbi:3611_t:CDS:1, partial [Racocetra fulgida]